MSEISIIHGLHDHDFDVITDDLQHWSTSYPPTSINVIFQTSWCCILENALNCVSLKSYFMDGQNFHLVPSHYSIRLLNHENVIVRRIAADTLVYLLVILNPEVEDMDPVDPLFKLYAIDVMSSIIEFMNKRTFETTPDEFVKSLIFFQRYFTLIRKNNSCVVRFCQCPVKRPTECWLIKSKWVRTQLIQCFYENMMERFNEISDDVNLMTSLLNSWLAVAQEDSVFEDNFVGFIMVKTMEVSLCWNYNKLVPLLSQFVKSNKMSSLNGTVYKILHCYVFAIVRAVALKLISCSREKNINDLSYIMFTEIDSTWLTSLFNVDSLNYANKWFGGMMPGKTLNPSPHPLGLIVTFGVLSLTPSKVGDDEIYERIAEFDKLWPSNLNICLMQNIIDNDDYLEAFLLVVTRFSSNLIIRLKPFNTELPYWTNCNYWWMLFFDLINWNHKLICDLIVASDNQFILSFLTFLKLLIQHVGMLNSVVKDVVDSINVASTTNLEKGNTDSDVSEVDMNRQSKRSRRNSSSDGRLSSSSSAAQPYSEPLTVKLESILGGKPVEHCIKFEENKEELNVLTIEPVENDSKCSVDVKNNFVELLKNLKMEIENSTESNRFKPLCNRMNEVVNLFQ